MWASTLSALKRLLSAVLSILAVPISGFASGLTWLALKGRNYSDVGLPMYENSSVATFVAFLVFFIALFGLLYVLQRTISRNAPYFPYVIAGITCVGLVVSFFILLHSNR